MDRLQRRIGLQRQTIPDQRWPLCHGRNSHRKQLCRYHGDRWHHLLLCGVRQCRRFGNSQLQPGQCRPRRHTFHRDRGIIAWVHWRLWRLGDVHRHAHHGRLRVCDVQGWRQSVRNGHFGRNQPGHLHHQHPRSGRTPDHRHFRRRYHLYGQLLNRAEFHDHPEAIGHHRRHCGRQGV